MKSFFDIIENKIQTTQSTLNSSLNTFLHSNLRKDRDRVLRLKAKLETYNELLTLISK